MKGYKVTNKDLNCHSLTYEIGREYEFLGNMLLEYSGFHFYDNPDHIPNYELENGWRVFEVEASGEIITDGVNYVTDKIKLVRELSYVELNDELLTSTLDEHGNFLEYDMVEDDTLVRYEHDYTYNEEGVIIKHVKTRIDYFDVDKTIEQFDDNGNMIYCELNDGGVLINQHFKNGNLIYNVKNFYEKDRDNKKILNMIVATHYEYDDYNNIVKQDVYNNGIKQYSVDNLYTYSDGNIIKHTKLYDGIIKRVINCYYNNNNLIEKVIHTFHSKFDYNTDTFYYKYDKENRLTEIIEKRLVGSPNEYGTTSQIHYDDDFKKVRTSFTNVKALALDYYDKKGNYLKHMVNRSSSFETEWEIIIK